MIKPSEFPAQAENSDAETAKPETVGRTTNSQNIFDIGQAQTSETDREPISRRTTGLPDQQNTSGTDPYTRAALNLVGELVQHFPNSVPAKLPRLDPNYRRPRPQYIAPPAQRLADGSDLGLLQFDITRIWQHEKKLLLDMLETLMRAKVTQDTHKVYSNGYLPTCWWRLAVKLEMAIEIGPTDSARKPNEHFQYCVREGGKADRGIDQILSGPVFAGVRAVIPPPVPESEAAVLIRRQRQNQSQLAWICRKEGEKHNDVSGKSTTDLLCARCFKESGEIVELVLKRSCDAVDGNRAPP